MMKSSLPSHNPIQHESHRTIASKKFAGVNFTIRRITFGRRLELAQRIRELDRKLEFLNAGDDTVSKVDAAIFAREIDKIYLAWGFAGLDGIEIDGETASAESAIELGPEELIHEVLDAIKSEFSLSEEERKN